MSLSIRTIIETLRNHGHIAEEEVGPALQTLQGTYEIHPDQPVSQGPPPPPAVSPPPLETPTTAEVPVEAPDPAPAAPAAPDAPPIPPASVVPPV